MSKPELMLAAMGMVALANSVADTLLALIASLAQILTRRFWPEVGEVFAFVRQNCLYRLKARTVVQQAGARLRIAEARILEAAAAKSEIRLVMEYREHGKPVRKQTLPEKRALRNRTESRSGSK